MNTLLVPSVEGVAVKERVSDKQNAYWVGCWSYDFFSIKFKSIKYITGKKRENSLIGAKPKWAAFCDPTNWILSTRFARFDNIRSLEAWQLSFVKSWHGYALVFNCIATPFAWKFQGLFLNFLH
jgi:hypothetical protein